MPPSILQGKIPYYSSPDLQFTSCRVQHTAQDQSNQGQAALQSENVLKKKKNQYCNIQVVPEACCLATQSASWILPQLGSQSTLKIWHKKEREIKTYFCRLYIQVPSGQVKFKHINWPTNISRKTTCFLLAEANLNCFKWQ